MKMIIDIIDKDAEVGIKVLNSLYFVRKSKKLSKDAETLVEDLKAAATEVELHKKGKLKMKTAKDLLNEL